MRAIVLVILMGLAACSARKPTTLQLRERPRVENHRVRFAVACTPAPCPDDKIAITTPSGARDTDTMSPDGEVDFVTPVGVDEGLPVDVTTSRSYAREIAIFDLAVLLAGGLVTMSHGDVDTGAIRVVYVMAAPIVHLAHRNRSRAVSSALRRAVLAAIPELFARAKAECDGDVDTCGADRPAVSTIGWLITVPISTLWDMAVADVDVPLDITPSVTPGRDATMLGVAGRF